MPPARSPLPDAALPPWGFLPGCTGKVRHNTEREAVVAAVLHGPRGRPLRAYACKHCDGWHVTSKPLRAGPA